jgi:hypothetical protein
MDQGSYPALRDLIIVHNPYFFFKQSVRAAISYLYTLFSTPSAITSGHV